MASNDLSERVGQKSLTNKYSLGGIDQTRLIRKRGQKGLAILDEPEQFDQNGFVTENCPERIGQSALAKYQPKQIDWTGLVRNDRQKRLSEKDGPERIAQKGLAAKV